MTNPSDLKDFLLLLVFLIIFILFLIFISSHYFLILRFKTANLFERWRIKRLKNKEKRSNERFKFKTKNFTSDCAEKEIKYLNSLMDKNEMFLSLGPDRYFDLELTPEKNGSFCLIIFRPYSVDSLDIDALPEVKRIIESTIRIDFNNLIVHYRLGGSDEEKTIKGLVLEELIKAAIIIAKEHIVKSYCLRRFDRYA